MVEGIVVVFGLHHLQQADDGQDLGPRLFECLADRAKYGMGDVWEAPADHLVEYGRVVLVPENVKGAADLGLAEVEKREDVQVGEELLHQVRVEEELLLHTDFGVRGHLFVVYFYQLHVFLLVCSF